jgi:hypothetical protein
MLNNFGIRSQRSSVLSLLTAILIWGKTPTDSDLEIVRVSIKELTRGCPVPEEKCRLLMEQFASEPGTGIAAGGDRDVYEIDPIR